jgi:hypothetical protein
MNFPHLFSPLKVGPYQLARRDGGEDRGHADYPADDEMAQA